MNIKELFVDTNILVYSTNKTSGYYDIAINTLKQYRNNKTSLYSESPSNHLMSFYFSE